MTSKHVRRGSASPVIRERQMRSAMRYQLTPIRMAAIGGRMPVGEGVEKREPWALLVGVSNGAAALGKSLAVPPNTKNRITL